MYFSAKELAGLVIDVLEENNFDDRSVHQLLYFLHFPTSQVPLTIAEVLCSDGSLLTEQNRLGRRLALGHIEDLSQIRDIELRASRQARIGRQLNRVVLYLASQKAPSTIGDQFSHLLERFVHILHFFDTHKETPGNSYAAEEAFLIERIFEIFGLSIEIGERFLTLAFERLKPHQAKILALKLAKRLDECEGRICNSEPLHSLIDPSQTPSLSENIITHPGFNKHHNIFSRILESFGGPLPKLH
ncbi:MAG TPA: hypothetical protein PKA63_08485 [Oligoflexia bacterium]|nr:hypothetical protein [Oligoflexia bacterium]HMP48687.1 hypothetical protein [Oligoflexia bacterium]